MKENSIDRSFESLQVGESISREHAISQEMIASFAELSGDQNPLHVDESYAKKTEFGRTIAHGMLLGALVSECIGMHLPGKRCLLVKETLEFKKPVYAGDTVVIEGVIVRKSTSTGLLEISVRIVRREETVAEGVVHTKIINPHE